ncbi:MAG: urocanate hydratase [Planctomycetota bacterium]|nr:MAG: urocanate hydratase [Planctomycetota bacterium]
MTDGVTAQPTDRVLKKDFREGYEGPVKAPTGTKIKAASWLLEAPRRMLLNNLDPEVAEAPDQLVVYGGTGRAARSWPALRAMLHSLETMRPDETLCVQSGKPVSIFRTHEDAPRVLIANSNLVPKWATRDEHARLEGLGLTMFGQMTAGSWIYIGSQGIVQGTFETFAACGRTHFNGDLVGELVVSGGLGGMGGAQPLAATMAGATFLGADVDGTRIDKRLASGYIDQRIDDMDAAIDAAVEATSACNSISIGVCCNVIDLLERMIERNITPGILTDQTSAHDPIYGYVPQGLTLAEAEVMREADPKGYEKRSLAGMSQHIDLMLELKSRGAVTFDYGNNLRGGAAEGGHTHPFDIEGFVPLYIRPLFCLGKGPFRWVALSGDPADIYRTDELVLEMFGQDSYMEQWIHLAREKIQFQGLPARICWLGYGERARFGLALNELVANGELKAPIVIGRDHLDAGSVASPARETEGMLDGSDAIADWPLLNAMLNTAAGATWVSLHHGGGVGIGNSIHAGMVVVADGTEAAARRIERVLTTDPGMGVVRHVDAGYPAARAFARNNGIQTPMPE